MPLVNKSLPSFIGGVSEQPPSLRHPTQVTSMLNCSPSVALGVSKRSGSDLMFRASTANLVDAYVFHIDRGTAGTSERYFGVVTNSDLKVFAWDGTEQTVNKPDGTGYLGATTPRTSFDHATIADHTVIANKLVTVTTSAASPVSVTPALYVVVKVGVVDTDYRVTLNGTTYTLSIGNSAGVNQTEEIAGGLLTAINGGGVFTATRTENRLKIVKNDAADFTWSVTDSYGDGALFAFRDTVQRFEELPRKFDEDVVIKVTGSPDAPNDGWYVKWQKQGGVGGDGVWVETRANNIATALNAFSMPHVLVRENDGTWTFRHQTWAERTVGDDNSAPMPSFVGHTIKKVFFFRNRLGFLSDENVVLGQVDDYFNMFPTTARAVVDSDPIDVSAGSVSSKINFLRGAVPFDKALFVTSNGQQYQFGGQELLSPKTARLSPTTAFETADCNPVAMGSNVLFVSQAGNYSGLREYYFDPDATGNDALDVTAHVPTFIPGTAFQMAAQPALDQLYVLTGIRSEFPVYTAYWNGQEKVQSSWHRWAFGGSPSVVSLMPFNTTLVAALQYPEGLFFVKMELDRRQITDGALLWPVRLDRKFQASDGVFDSGTPGYTTWTLPYNYNSAMQAVVLNKSGEIGQVLDLQQVSPTVVGHSGDYSGCTVVIGEKYTAAMTLSEFFIRDKDDKPLLDVRLQLRDVTMSFTGTGYFESHVFPAGRDSFAYPYTGRVLGVSGVTLGQRTMQDGEFRFPVMAKSDEVSIVIQSDQAVPFNIQAGQFSGVSARISQRA